MALGQDTGGLGNPFAGAMPVVLPTGTPQPAPVQVAGINPGRRSGGGNPFLSGPTTNYSTRLGSVLGLFGMPTFEQRQARATSAAAATFGKLVQGGRPPAAALIETMNTPEGQAAFSDPAQWNSFLNTVQAMATEAPKTLTVSPGQALIREGETEPYYQHPAALGGGEGTQDERFRREMVNGGFWSDEQGRAALGNFIDVQVLRKTDVLTGLPNDLLVTIDKSNPLNPVVTQTPVKDLVAAGVTIPPAILSGSPAPAAPSAGGDINSVGIDAAREALGQIESSGRYGVKGPRNSKLGYPLGKYQIMEANLPQWSREALGRSVTSQEFMRSPELQDKVATFQMQKLYDKYGNWDDVASAWLTGNPLKAAGGAKDVYGTDAPEYIRRFRAALGQGGVAAPLGNFGPPEGWTRNSVDPGRQWYRTATPDIPRPEEMFGAAGAGGFEEGVGAGIESAGGNYDVAELTAKKAAVNNIRVALQGLKESRTFASEAGALLNMVPDESLLSNEGRAITQAINSVEYLLGVKQQAVAVTQDLSASVEARKDADARIDQANAVLKLFPDLGKLRARQDDLKSGRAQMQTWFNTIPRMLKNAGAFTQKGEEAVGELTKPSGRTAQIAKLKSAAEVLAFVEANPDLTPEERAAVNQRLTELQSGGQ